jgi:hypothetical protein
MNVRFSGIGSPAPLRAASVVAAQARCSRIHGDQIGESVISRWTIDYAETIRGSGNGTMN